MTAAKRKLAELMGEVVDTNRSLASGMAELMVGQHIVAASAEVYDSDGGVAFALRTQDGSVFECVVSARVSGPAGELVKMAGGVSLEDVS